MSDLQEFAEPKSRLEGLQAAASKYFIAAEAALNGMPEVEDNPFWLRMQGVRERREARDVYWSALPDGLRADADGLIRRLIPLMSELAQRVRNAPLLTEADQLDLTMATKTMRAALLLRRFRAWNAEVLNDEDTVLGVQPAGQSDSSPLTPSEALDTFLVWAQKTNDILDLLTGSAALEAPTRGQIAEAVRYRPSTAFIMMWMDRSKPELTDVCDTVKTVFSRFGIRAVRADDIEHEGLITQRVLDEIKTSEFCFADVSGQRPNVYYEIGYAHALGRRVLLYRRSGTALHFDLAGYNCPDYENLRDLTEKLSQRLRAITNKEPTS